MISKNWRVSEKIIVFLFLMFDSVGRINDNLAKNNRKDKGRWRIWTPDGFWRSLSDSRLRPAGRCQWTPCVAPRYNARLPVQSWLLCAVQWSSRWMGRSAVLRCSGSRTTYPPAAPAQHQQTNGELGNYNSAIPSLGLLSISRAWLRFGKNHIVVF